MKLAQWLLAAAIVSSPYGWVSAQRIANHDPCTSQNETVYHADVDNVKPPAFIKDEYPEEIKGSARLELLIDSRGRICSIGFLDRTDRELGSKLAEHIVKYWKFSPATRGGKPVAAFFRISFPAVNAKSR